MSNFQIDLHGFNRVQNKLRRMAAQMPKVSQAVIYKWAQGTRAILKSTRYPPKRAAQLYRRTGRLANSWRAVRLPDGATIINNASQRGHTYARYVIGNARGGGQAWMHKGRWWKARDVIRTQLPRLRKALATAIKAEWSKR